MDPALSKFRFERFMDLPENVHESILSFCDVKTKLNMSETCKHLNRLLFSSSKLINRVKLSLNAQFFENSQKDRNLLHILNNGRKYQNLELYVDKSLECKLSDVLSHLMAISSSIKDLKIERLRNIPQLNEALEIFNNTEKLAVKIERTFIVLQKTNPICMPNLKDLVVKNGIRDSSALVIELLENVKTLTRFELHTNYQKARGIKVCENFIMQQFGLKHLTYVRYCEDRVVPWSLFSKANFLLESIDIRGFSLDHNAVEFFKKQTNLKTVRFEGYFSTGTDLEALKAMLTLPKLQSLTINKCFESEDLRVLSDVCNPSVLKLKFSEKVPCYTEVFEALISYFPNLQEIKIFEYLILTETPYEKLALMQFDPIDEELYGFNPNQLNYFIYQPFSDITDQESFEDFVSNFLDRHRDIKCLTIGHENWITNNFKLSLGFCAKLVELKRLDTLVLYNPMKITTLIAVLANMEKIHSVTIYTSAEDAAAVAADGPHKRWIGPWLDIVKI